MGSNTCYHAQAFTTYNIIHYDKIEDGQHKHPIFLKMLELSVLEDYS